MFLIRFILFPTTEKESFLMRQKEAQRRPKNRSVEPYFESRKTFLYSASAAHHASRPQPCEKEPTEPSSSKGDKEEGKGTTSMAIDSEKKELMLTYSSNSHMLTSTLAAHTTCMLL